MHARHRRYHFGHFASTIAWAVGHPLAFGLAVLGIVLWLAPSQTSAARGNW